MLQRDIFIEEIIKKLSSDDNIYFLSADFGAAALDKLREQFPKNFIHCGISEQAMLDDNWDSKENSRLACQIPISENIDLLKIELAPEDL